MNATEIARLDRERLLIAESFKKNMAKPNADILFMSAKKRIDETSNLVDDDQVASRIRDLIDTMQERGMEALTYPQMAKLCGVNEKNVWNWARAGKVSKKKLPVLAHVLGTTVEYLLTGFGDEQEVTVETNIDNTIEVTRASEAIRLIPVLEPTDLIDPENKQATIEKVLAKFAKDRERFAVHAIPIKDHDDLGVPSFAMQMTSNIFADIPKGAFLLFSHRLQPHNNEFSLWLTTKETIDGALERVIVGGYTQYVGIPDTFQTIELERLVASSPVRLMADYGRPRADDIELAPCHMKDGVLYASRQLLGTCVAIHFWTQSERVRRHSNLENRLQKKDDLSGHPSHIPFFRPKVEYDF